MIPIIRPGLVVKRLQSPKIFLTLWKTCYNVKTYSTESIKQKKPQDLNWPTFLKLRKSRRIFETLTSIPTALTGLGLGSAYFLTRTVDPTMTIMGLDLFTLYVIGTIASGGLGWLLGPSIGRKIWTLLHKSQARQIAAREQEFYRHLVKNRVTPQMESYSNPIPDYYGEKIYSLSDYRRWLRDQKAYIQRAFWRTSNR
ncbi:TIM23 translocase complex-associated motor subunit Pam17 [Schizosaccharomyces pombe]|uniref:Presequence translocated-associated motor subunit pam17, mitochondrial n=1 Tax=Schizosaccharomyces pombe (strain 972 / ATCC 24843) TaxID=284812 RepID=PAM17_SCHPO